MQEHVYAFPLVQAGSEVSSASFRDGGVALYLVG